MANAKPARPVDPADVLLKEVEAALQQSSSWLCAHVGMFLDLFSPSLGTSPNHVSIRSPYSDSRGFKGCPLDLWEQENPKPKRPLKDANLEEKETYRAAYKDWDRQRRDFILSEIERVSQTLSSLASAHGFRYAADGTQVYLLPRKKVTARRRRR